MKFDLIVEFFNSDYVNVVTGIIAVVAFGMSLYNFIMPIVKSRLNLDAGIRRYSVPTGTHQLVKLDIMNNSHAKIIITDITILIGNFEFPLNNTTRFTNKEKKEFVSELPLSIAGEDCYTGIFAFQCNGSRIASGEATIVLKTHKGESRVETILPEPSDVQHLMPVLREQHN